MIDGRSACNRLAVLVGIRDYSHLPQLATPYQDVRAIARMLKGLGFEVHEIADGPEPKTSETIRAKLIEIRSRLAELRSAAASNPSEAPCVLFYFAGHGVLHLDEIYLLDEEARMNEAAFRSHSISLNEVLHDLGPLPDIPKIVLLDCCQSAAQAVSGSGLRLPREVSYQTVIGFSTSPGHVAMDAYAHGHSPYATAICRHFPTPGSSLVDVMTRVAGAVRDYSGGAQSAMHLATLCEPLVLAPSTPPPAGQKAAPNRQTGTKVAPVRSETRRAPLDFEEDLHRVRICKFRDADGRSAWYVLLLDEGVERDFVASAGRDGGVDLASYGRVLAREYGEVLSDGLCAHVESRHGARVADKLRSARARLTPAAPGAT